MFEVPYDSQECFLEFGNLVEPDTMMNITLEKEVGFNLDFYSNSNEFHIKSTDVSRNTWTVSLIEESISDWFILFLGIIHFLD